MKHKNSMQENGSPIETQNDDFTNTSSTDNEYSKWVDNQGCLLYTSDAADE